MQNEYLIRKKPLNALVLFSLPIIAGNLFQQTYTMIDSVIVGRVIGEEALAAIGASYSLTNIFICVAVGAGLGASVLVSRYFGAKQYEKMKTVVYTSLTVFLILGICLGVIGLLFGGRIMTAFNTPVRVLGIAEGYLDIYFMGLPFLFMYNILSAMLNALGKSWIPLCFLVFSSVCNMILDIIFVVYLHMGVQGAAWATFFSQGTASIFSFIVLMMQIKKTAPGKTVFFEKKELVPMAKISLPSVLQQSTISIGIMLVQSVVNSFGSETLAGFSAAARIESVCIVPMSGIGNAISSYTAQNIGAKKDERVPQGYHAANILVLGYAVVICIILECFNDKIIGLFLGSDHTEIAVATGRSYLVFMGFFFCLIGFKMSIDGILRGAGDMKMFTVANLVNLSIRVSVAMLLAPKYGVYMIWIVVPMGWFINWLISFLRYRTGKWKNIYKK